MDLTRFLKNQSPPSDDEDMDEAPPIVRVPSLNEGQRNQRLAMHKRKSNFGDIRGREAALKKSKRQNQKFENLKLKRGVVVAQVETDPEIEDEDEDDDDDDDDEVVFQQQPEVATAEVRQPLKEKPTRPNVASERMKKLAEWRVEKLRKKNEDTKSKKPPFKVGTYKLEASATTVKPENFKFNSTMQNFAFGAKSNTPRGAMGYSKPLQTASTSASQQSTNKPAEKQKRQIQTKPPAKKPTIKTPAANVSTDQGRAADRGHELNTTYDAIDVVNDDDQQIEATSSEKSQLDKSCQIPSLTESPSNSNDKTENLTVNNHPVEEAEKAPGSEEKLNQTPTGFRVADTQSENVFKTPIMPVGTPKERKTGRSNRRTGAGLLLDSLRSDITSERGSSADKLRRRMGRPGAKTPAEILGLEDLCRDIEQGSPMNVLLKKAMMVNDTDGDAAVATTRPLQKPKKLDDDFDKISETDDVTVEATGSEAGTLNSNAAATNNCVAAASNNCVPAASNVSASECEPERDVKYFRDILKRETDKLEEMCAFWSAKISDSLSEEIQGQIRTVIGLARLSMDRKGRFTQFENLIDNCEFSRGEKETTCQDLQGFWDMIYYQMEDIAKKFEELSILESNNWIIPEPEKKKPVKKKAPKVVASRPKPVVAARSNIRAIIEAKRRAMEAGNVEQQVDKPKTPTIEGDVSNPDRVFDGGFFKVTTPNKTVATVPSPISGIAKRLSNGPLTPLNRGKPMNKRLSELLMSTHRLRLNDTADFEGSGPSTPTNLTGKPPSASVTESTPNKNEEELMEVDTTPFSSKRNTRRQSNVLPSLKIEAPKNDSSIPEELAKTPRRSSRLSLGVSSPIVKDLPLIKSASKRSNRRSSLSVSNNLLSPDFQLPSRALEPQRDVPKSATRRTTRRSILQALSEESSSNDENEANLKSPRQAKRKLTASPQSVKRSRTDQLSQDVGTPKSPRASAKRKSASVRASMIPDLISFDSPNPPTPRRTSRRSSVASKSNLDR